MPQSVAARPVRAKARTSSPGRRDQRPLPARPAVARLLVGDAVSISPRAVAGRKHHGEAIVRMARLMSSRRTGRRDPARVPSAALCNRILARSRLPVLIVLLTIGYGTAGYWLIEDKSLLDALYATMLTLSTLGVEA